MCLKQTKITKNKKSLKYFLKEPFTSQYFKEKPTEEDLKNYRETYPHLVEDDNNVQQRIISFPLVNFEQKKFNDNLELLKYDEREIEQFNENIVKYLAFYLGK